MPDVNSVGDLVLTEPGAMRALADPVRLALLDRLRRQGPATPAELGDASSHLRELERFGLVERSDGDRWSAVGKGFVFEIPDDPEGEAAGRALSKAMLMHYLDVPKRWAVDDEPELELEWVRAAGLLNARVAVTSEELRNLQEGLEQLLEPFITREPGDVPAGARPVRILSYFLP
jgi:DNA-binding transcriptional ArsR family regulator